MNDYKIILTSVMPTLTTVRLYTETLEHVKEEHPELPIEFPFLLDAITTTISSPSHIELSYSNSFVFVDQETTNRSGDPIRIPIKVIEGTTSGRVKSIYFASPSYIPIITWRKGDG